MRRVNVRFLIGVLACVLLLAGGGVVLPTTSYGGFGALLSWLPSGALGDAMRSALLDGRTDWTNLALLLVWAAIGTALTARTFTWE